jgi:hypothetical protein
MTIFGKLLTSGLVIVFVLLGYFFVTHQKQVSSSNVSSTTVQIQKKIPFSELVKQQGPYACTIAQYSDGSSTQGLVYISGDRIRGIFTVASGDKNIDSNVLILDGYTYSWVSHMKGNGYKIKNKENNLTSTTTKDTSYTWDPSSVGDYSCKEWSVDETMFALPKEVTFTEVKK